ncbi:hypothetical protein VTH06DRAFT_4960 [Thermothelomyces fergusii]
MTKRSRLSPWRPASSFFSLFPFSFLHWASPGSPASSRLSLAALNEKLHDLVGRRRRRNCFGFGFAGGATKENNLFSQAASVFSLLPGERAPVRNSICGEGERSFGISGNWEWGVNAGG